MNHKQNISSVLINTTARLHMGFFDLNGQGGRQFGSLGLSLDAPSTKVELTMAQGAVESQHEQDYVFKNKRLVLDYLGIAQNVDIQVLEQVPRHSGLGSGTQMALAIGVGICRLFNRHLSLQEIAQIVGRGARSGIGIGTFAQGGLVLDGGRGKHTQIPPIIARYDFPASWRILLIFDHQNIGVHGAEEHAAFKMLKPHDQALTEKLSYHILMQALPALVEADLKQFGEAIAILQAYTGDYFAPIQGGRYASKSVTQVLEYLREQGTVCVGQSSWGPTGFAVFESQIEAERLTHQLKLKYTDSDLSWLICSAQNTGATVIERNKPENTG
ncbi:MAG TPA: GHMP kinase [Methylophilaceae bacterium]|nr:GHMP kinase [Methylophilaceae bacterium]